MNSFNLTINIFILILYQKKKKKNQYAYQLIFKQKNYLKEQQFLYNIKNPMSFLRSSDFIF